MAMLDTEGGIMKLSSFRVGYIKSTSLSSSVSSRSHSEDHDSNDEAADSSTVDSVFSRPSVLIRLAQFLQKIQHDNGSWTGKKSMPLLLAAEKKTGWIVVGVSATGTSQVLCVLCCIYVYVLMLLLHLCICFDAVVAFMYMF